MQRLLDWLRRRGKPEPEPEVEPEYDENLPIFVPLGQDKTIPPGHRPAPWRKDDDVFIAR